MPSSSIPRLTLGHVTLAARDMNRLSTFYCDVLGFEITDRGSVGDNFEIAFLCQDPRAHHQIAMVSGVAVTDPAFLLVDHLAFQTGTLDDLRTLQTKLVRAKIEGILQICHGNAWSLYFKDCEGNGLECFVDTPFHVAQPFAQGFDLDQSDEEIFEATRKLVESETDFQPMQQWQDAFAKSLDLRPGSDG